MENAISTKAIARNSNISKAIRTVRMGLYLYLLLLLLEGALRKWFLPSLEAPLLIIRDPIAIFILLLVFRFQLIRFNIYMLLVLVATIFSVAMAFGVGHGNVFVAVYGARIFLIHFPLIFVFGTVFSREDVIKMGRFIVWLLIPMTVIIGLQYFSPQSAWINRGVGGDLAGSGFGVHYGYFRPSGVFSFTSGNVGFFRLAFCFLLFFWTTKKKWIPLPLLFLMTLVGIVGIPLSYSRTLVIGVAATLMVWLFVSIRNPRVVFRVVAGVLFLSIVLLFVSRLPFAKTSLEVLGMRFTDANASEGGTVQSSVYGRFFAPLLNPFFMFFDIPFWGMGIGLGTNAGSKILYGERLFLVAETEWERIVGEMGILGYIVLLVRTHMVFRIAKLSWRASLRENTLPLLLFSYAFFEVFSGQWAQPTILGFAVVSTGFVLAALKKT